MRLGAGEFFGAQWCRRFRDGMQRAGGAADGRDQAGGDEPFQGFVRGAVQNFEAHGGDGFEFCAQFGMERCEARTMERGLAFHDDIEHRVRAVAEEALLASDQCRAELPASFLGEGVRSVGGLGQFQI